MIDAYQVHRLLSQIPSSKATPMSKPKSTFYTIMVQRRETSGNGRWRELASWVVSSTETDQYGPLNCGLRENYRITVTEAEGPKGPATGYQPGSAAREPSDPQLAAAFDSGLQIGEHRD